MEAPVRKPGGLVPASAGTESTLTLFGQGGQSKVHEVANFF
jgi:hypothetical protein